MAPKAAAKAKKAPALLPEPEDKNTPPDLSAVAADFHGTDLEAQQQALTRLFAIREYPGAKIAVASHDIITSIVTLASSDSNEVVSKEFLEGCLRCMVSMCFASDGVCQQLSSFNTAPLVALYQHASPKIQERACQLTAALAMNTAACMSLVPACLQGLLALCSTTSGPAVREQACRALCGLARPSAGCHACSHLQAAGAPATLLQLLQGAGDVSRSSSQAEEHAALLLCRIVETQPQAAMQVVEAGGLQTLLALLPAPQSSTVSADAASAPSAAAAPTPAATPALPAWANKPASHRLQTCLLQLLAALLQSQPARSTLLADGSNSSMSSTACCGMLLNILEAEAPLAPAAPPPAVPILAGGKGPAVGKADGKAKPAGKGKADAGPPVPIAPPAELVPPFPASSQLPAVQCLQELAKEPALVAFLLKGPLLKQLSKILVSPTDQLVQHSAVLLQYMALNAEPDQLPAAEVKAVMSSLAQHSLKSGSQLLQAAVGSAACSLPASLLLPDAKPPLPSPSKTPPPPPLPLSKFIWDAMEYENLAQQQFIV
ncbi:hypothetical protein ABBQ32_013704 [Trebouxia sp. C0010 RCD-2024]